MCAVRKADTHIRLRAASSEGLGVGAQGNEIKAIVANLPPGFHLLSYLMNTT